MYALLLAALAFAVDGHPTWILPSAAPMQAGDVSVGIAGGGGTLLFSEPFPALAVEAGWAPHDRVSIHAVGGSAFGGLEFDGAGLVALRVDAVEHPAIRVSPWVLGAATTANSAAGALGLALEAGWPRVRFDLTSPILLYAVAPESDPTLRGLPLYPEGGVSFYPGDGHRIRLGFPVLLSYRYGAPRWYGEVGLTFIGIAAGGVARVGARF